jgi:hypothetical protein
LHSGASADADLLKLAPGKTEHPGVFGGSGMPFNPGDEKGKLEVLLTRYKDQAALLQAHTRLDMQLLVGYISLHVLAAAWFLEHPVVALTLKGVLTGIAALAALVASSVVWLRRARRDEVVETLRNVCTALRLNEPGFYLEGCSVNPQVRLGRPPRWGAWVFVFLLIIVGAFAGIVAALWLGA